MSKLVIKLLASLFIVFLVILYEWFIDNKLAIDFTIGFYIILYVSIFLSLFIIDKVSYVLERIRLNRILSYIIYMITGMITIPLILYVLFWLTGIISNVIHKL